MSHRDGAQEIDTPACILAIVRHLPGWSLGYHKTECQLNGTLIVTVRLFHRGAFTVPRDSFKHLRGFQTLRVHSFFSGQRAFVWLTLRKL